MTHNEPSLYSGQSRRHFVKTFAQIGAYFGLCAPVCRYFVGEVQAQSSGLIGLFNISLAVSPFTALQQLNGSVKVEVPNGTLGTPSLVAVNNATPMIIITRVATTGDSQFGALSQRCGHQQNAVNPKVAGQNYLECPVHFARYNQTTGAVVQQPIGGGAVALSAYLAVFTAAPAPGTLQIRIAGIGYSIGHALEGTTAKRLRLRFPTRSGTNYQVMFRSSVTGTQSAIQFFNSLVSTTPLSQIPGTGAELSAYVNPPQQTGFYLIAAIP